MKKRLFISMVLVVCMLLCSCGNPTAGVTQGEELIIKISYESPGWDYGPLNAQSCFSRDPIVAADSGFGETLKLKSRVFEEDKFIYTYDWGEITPTDKVYMQPAIVVIPKVDSVRCFELEEGLITDIDGDEWFTVEAVNTSTKTMGFDGYTSMGITIKKHSGIFPHRLWIAVNGDGQGCEAIVQTAPEYGQYTMGEYLFQLNAFDVMVGNLILITSPKQGLYNEEDVFTLMRSYKTEIEADVEVEVVK